MSQGEDDRMSWGAGQVVLSQCVYCEYMGSRPEMAGALYCRAYPSGGIPDGILLNDLDHRKPQLDDGGVLFSPRADLAPGALAALYKRLDEAKG